jgi:3-hydroxy-9,10-secoandrosta-1,3,5(10)-triene-9,17-dione monooxygenase
MRAELVERASTLVPTLKRRALETEQLRRLPDSTVKDIVQSQLVRVGVPPRFGGLADDYDVAYDIAAELGRGCGASAWCYSLWAVHTWMVGHFPEPAQHEFYAANGPDTLCSSSFFAGKSLQCEPVSGGMRVSGRWEFSSGSDASSWVMLGVGPPGVIGLVPRSDYEVLDTWFASGLCGSGSNDIVVDDAFIPTHRLLDINRAGLDDHTAWKLHGRPTYRLPLRVLLAWDLVAPLIGIARGMLDAFVERARAAPSAVESDVIHLRFAESSAEVDAARVLLRHSIDRLLETGERGERFTDEERARVGRDRAFVVRLCIQAVNRLFDVSGGHALFLSDPLQRCHRDAHAVSHRAGLMLESVGPPYGRAALLPPR